jgi:hypothetical protein
MQSAIPNLSPTALEPLEPCSGNSEIRKLELLFVSGREVETSTRYMPAGKLRLPEGEAHAVHLRAARDLWTYLYSHAPSGVMDEVLRLAKEYAEA